MADTELGALARAICKLREDAGLSRADLADLAKKIEDAEES